MTQSISPRRSLRYHAGSAAIAFMAAAAAVSSGAPLPAFPGAEGFGADAVGGRGGRVIEVTNLNDAGSGSLREAVEAKGPRTVVFRVAGTIELLTELVLSNPYITIAGQTAPGEGIAIKTHRSNPRSALTIKGGAHDVILRHVRIRPGPHDGFRRGQDTSEVKDALQILDAHRIIVDHCSFSWATDEVVSTFFDAHDVTIQWCIISEGLVKSRPDQSLPGKGLLIGSKGAERISVHHNLMVHNIGRNPLIKALGIVDVVNNVVLAPDKVAMAIQSEHGLSPANFVGNFVIAPKAEGHIFGVRALGRTPLALFVQGNIGPHRQKPDQPEDQFIDPNNNGRRWRVEQRHEAPPITASPADEAFDQVLAGAGCTRPVRDSVDARVVEDVRALRSRLVNDPAEVGGWPLLAPGEPPADQDHDGMPNNWEKTHALDPNDSRDGSADRDQDGYTNLEEYLNGTKP